MNDNAVMSPVHPGWSEFITRLARAENCLQTTENARDLLEEWSGIDAEESLRALRARGGYCDCEIVNALGGVVQDQDHSLGDGDDDFWGALRSDPEPNEREYWMELLPQGLI